MTSGPLTLAAGCGKHPRRPGGASHAPIRYDEAWVEDWLITDRGLVGLTNAGTSFAELGRGRRQVEPLLEKTGVTPGKVLRE